MKALHRDRWGRQGHVLLCGNVLLRGKDFNPITTVFELLQLQRTRKKCGVEVIAMPNGSCKEWETLPIIVFFLFAKAWSPDCILSLPMGTGQKFVYVVQCCDLFVLLIR